MSMQLLAEYGIRFEDPFDPWHSVQQAPGPDPTHQAQTHLDAGYPINSYQWRTVPPPRRQMGHRPRGEPLVAGEEERRCQQRNMVQTRDLPHVFHTSDAGRVTMGYVEAELANRRCAAGLRISAPVGIGARQIARHAEHGPSSREDILRRDQQGGYRGLIRRRTRAGQMSNFCGPGTG